MPEISQMKSSRFLKKEDCGNGMLLTIRTCELMNVAADGQPEEMKWCLTFAETEKPYVSNTTTRAVIAGFTGRSNSDNWGGCKIVLFNDPSVFFNGKTGGIRARPPKIQSSAGTSQGRPIPPASNTYIPPADAADKGAAENNEDVPF